MIVCPNKECDNYKHELEEHVEVCPACGGPTENVETEHDNKRKLAPIVCIASFASLIVAMLPSDIAFFAGMILMVACIVFACIIRQKMAIIFSVICAAAMFLLLLYFGYFEMLF